MRVINPSKMPKMRFSITQKLVLAFLGLTIFVLFASLGLSRWSFERGFRDYVSDREQVRLEVVRDVLAIEYRRSGGSWESTTQHRFEELISSTFPPRREQDAAGQSSELPGQPPPGPPPRRGGPPDERPPPNEWGDRHGPPPRPGGPQDDRLPPNEAAAPPGPPTALYDMNGWFVAGSELDGPDAELFRMPISVAGKSVGELRSTLRLESNSPQDVAFAEQQVNTGWTIGIVASILAAALSIALARGLLAPVRRMVADVSRLSSGDYSARLAETRNDELGQLMADLDHLGQTLEKDRSARQRWLADISHELRTPLTVLAGELEALKDGVRNFDTDQLTSLDQEVRRLRFLIEDLHELSVSDVGGLRYTFSPLDLGVCLESVIGAARKRARDIGLELEVRSVESATVNGDINRIDQLLQNLLENSIAYTDAPGRIEVSISLSNNSVIIEVNDTAPGASEDECERLFEPLYRREASRCRRTGGTGLGLAICKNIVEAHRGTIAASPSSLGGLSVRVVIPAASEAPE